MATDKKKIEKRWLITIWEFDKDTKEISATASLRSKPITERRAREIANERTSKISACWKITRAYR